VASSKNRTTGGLGNMEGCGTKEYDTTKVCDFNYIINSKMSDIQIDELIAEVKQKRQSVVPKPRTVQQL
jgi:hypothetical protein